MSTSSFDSVMQLFAHDKQTIPCYISIYGRQQELALTRASLEILNRYCSICSIINMETALMIRIDDLKLPLHILRAMITGGSQELIQDLKVKHRAYLEENCPKLVEELADS